MLHRVEAEPVRLRHIDEPAHLAKQHLVHVLNDRIAHVVDPIPEPPVRRPSRRIARVDPRVLKGLRRLTGIMLTVRIRIVPIELAIPRADLAKAVASVFERLFVRKSIHRITGEICPHRQIVIQVELC